MPIPRSYQNQNARETSNSHGNSFCPVSQVDHAQERVGKSRSSADSHRRKLLGMGLPSSGPDTLMECGLVWPYVPLALLSPVRGSFIATAIEGEGARSPFGVGLGEEDGEEDVFSQTESNGGWRIVLEPESQSPSDAS